MFINKFYEFIRNLELKIGFEQGIFDFYCILRIIRYTNNVPYGDVLASTGVWKIWLASRRKSWTCFKQLWQKYKR